MRGTKGLVTMRMTENKLKRLPKKKTKRKSERRDTGKASFSKYTQPLVTTALLTGPDSQLAFEMAIPATAGPA